MALGFVGLKDWKERKAADRKVQAVAGRAMAAFAGIKDAMAFAFAPPAVVELGNATGFDLQLQDRAGLGHDALMQAHADHWFVRETLGMLRRTLARLDVSSRSLFALIEPGSCFAGTLAELAFCADRAYMLVLPDEPEREPVIELDAFNFGLLPLVNDQSRLQRRFYEESGPLEAARAAVGKPLNGDAAQQLGLVTAALDDIDWEDEIRIAIEERAAMSPDALTGLEANLRFASQENMVTRIFGRLSAWQNWIFQRPNAVGDKGALKVYGKGDKAAFDWNRV